MLVWKKSKEKRQQDIKILLSLCRANQKRKMKGQIIMTHSQKAQRNNVQKDINAIVEEAQKRMNKEIQHYNGVRLRKCTAWVYESENFYSLRSYNTTVACIDKRTKICYDFLRMVYGFTSTSSQHISKFWHDYGAKKVLRWYSV